MLLQDILVFKYLALYFLFYSIFLLVLAPINFTKLGEMHKRKPGGCIFNKN